MTNDKPMAIEKLGGNGPDLLLIHGYGSDRQSWLATAPALFELASVWVMDLPGHGKADKDIGDGSLPALVERVRATMEATGLNQMHLLGHSLGGRICMELARQPPQAVQSLAVQSLALIAPAGAGAGINSDFLSRFHQAEDKDAVSEVLSTLVYDPRLISRSLPSVVLSYLEQPGTRDNLKCIATGIEQAQSDVDNCIEELHKHSLPCLTLWGEDDKVNPADETRLASLPGTIHRLKHCGHLPHIEKRVAANKWLQAFYSDTLNSDTVSG